MVRRTAGVAVLVAAGVVWPGCGAAGGAGDLLLRAEQLTVTPSTGPVTYVLVHNTGRGTFRGTVGLAGPAGWTLGASEQPVRVGAGQTVRVPFAIERGADSAENRYPVRVFAAGGGERIERSQQIVCASAPYYKPVVDGAFEDWAEAIPVTFETAGQKTTIETYWSRRRFSLHVAVEEQALRPMPAGWSGGPIDAVQVALAPRDAVTPAAGGKVRRYELLLAAAEGGGGRCLWLARPGDTAGGAAVGPEAAGAELAVVRRGGVTHYEWSMPLAAMPLIRPEPGREFCLSLLVHDPDGVGLRDWGEAAGLWPSQRKATAWVRWPGGCWGDRAPFDGKVEWGFCSSKH